MFFVRLKSKSLVLPARVSLTTPVEVFPTIVDISFSFFLHLQKKKKLHSQITFLFTCCSCTTLISVIFQIVLRRYTRKTFLSFNFQICMCYNIYACIPIIFLYFQYVPTPRSIYFKWILFLSYKYIHCSWSAFFCTNWSNHICTYCSIYADCVLPQPSTDSAVNNTE